MRAAFSKKIVVGCLIFLFTVTWIRTVSYLSKEKNVAQESKPLPVFKAPDQIFFEQLKTNLHFFTLDNGLEVIAYQNSSSPQVFTKLAYRVGSANESSTERGMAHLVEHMIFKGTKTKLSETDLDKLCVKFGAATNAFTSCDYTAYWFLSDKKNYPVFLDILSDCAQDARFDSQHLASELKAVIQEMNWGRDKYGNEAWHQCMLDVFPPNHGYHFDTIGFTKELAEMKASNLKDFFKKYYHPANATLFVIGDFDLEKLKNEVQEKFGPWDGSKDRISDSKPKVIIDAAVSEKTVFRATSLTTSIHYFYSPGIRDIQTYVHYGFLNKILTSESGRITRRLVDELEIATGVESFGGQLKDGGIFGVSVESTPENYQECRTAVMQELQKLFKDGITEEELSLAKPLIITHEVEKFEKMMEFQRFGSEFAGDLMDLYFSTGDPYTVFNIVSMYSAVSVESINEIIRQWLNPLIVRKYSIMPITQDYKAVWDSADEQIKADQAEILKNHQRTAPLEVTRFFDQAGSPEIYQFDVPVADVKLALENGLAIVAKHRPLAPFVNLMLVHRDFKFIEQSIDSVEACVAGMVLIEGSQGYSKEENLKTFDAIGAEAGFGIDRSSIGVCSSNLKEALEHFSRVLFNPMFKAGDIKKVCQIAKQNTLEAAKDENAASSREVQRQLFAKTCYDWSLETMADRYSNVSLSDVKKAYKETFQPQNYVLCLVGDLPENWLELVQKNFSAWSGDQKVFVGRTVVRPTNNAVQTEPVLLPLEKDQVLVRFGRPSDVKFDDKERQHLKVLNKLLFGSLGSKLYEIRERTGLFYGAGGELAGDSNPDYSIDSVVVRLNPGNIDRFKEELNKMFTYVTNNPFLSEMITGAKHSIFNKTVESMASNVGLASLFVTAEIWSLKPDFYKKSLDEVANTSPEDLVRLIKKYCNLENMVEVRAGGQAKILSSDQT